MVVCYGAFVHLRHSTEPWLFCYGAFVRVWFCRCNMAGHAHSCICAIAHSHGCFAMVHLCECVCCLLRCICAFALCHESEDAMVVSLDAMVVSLWCICVCVFVCPWVHSPWQSEHISDAMVVCHGALCICVVYTIAQRHAHEEPKRKHRHMSRLFRYGTFVCVVLPVQYGDHPYLAFCRSDSTFELSAKIKCDQVWYLAFCRAT